MDRVPSSRPRRVFYALDPWLATLLVLPALAFNGLLIFEELVDARLYRPPHLLIVGISAFGIFWALVLAYAVAKYRPRWTTLVLCVCIVLLDLASIAWWAYTYST